MKQQIVVIGLGRFGSAVAEALAAAGHDVLGIDSDHDIVQRYASRLSHVVQADAIDEETLTRLGIGEFDAAVVGITGALETSILATLLLKRLGVPLVIAKARNDLHGEILTRVGVDRVLFPERDTGLRLAHSWSSQDITDSLDIIEGYTVNRVLVPQELVGRTLEDAILRHQRGVSLLLLARGQRVTVYPGPGEVLQDGDVLVIAGRIEEVDRFFSALRETANR